MPNPTSYPLFEHWYKTNNYILDRCEQLPKSVRFTISSRMMTLSMEVLELIIEAIYSKERKPILRKINLHLEKLRVFFRLCKDRRYISIQQYGQVSKMINEAGKMCGGWLKSL
jgi:hypothetical protein